MNPRPSLSLLLPSLMLAGSLLITGCSDVVSVELPEPDSAASSVAIGEDGSASARGHDVAAWARTLQSRSKKARHFHLLERAYLPAPAHRGRPRTGAAAAGQAADGATSLDLQGLGLTTASLQTAGVDSVRLLVGVRRSAVADSVLNILIDKYKIFNRFEYKTAIQGFALTVPASNLDGFLTDVDTTTAVDWAEPDVDVPHGSGDTGSITTAQTLPWSIVDIGADRSSTAAGDGTGTVDVDLYVLDTGVESTDLNVVECLEFTRRSGAVPCASTTDPDGHGTSVATVAAAKDDQAGIVGVAPGARIHVVKALRERGHTPLGAMVAVVDYLTTRKLAAPSVPMVVNISLGANVKTTRYNGLDEAIRASIAAGVVYVISAGNDAIDAAKVSPAHVGEAITVGAYNEGRLFSSFSNYGPVLDLLAPGENVPALTPQGELVHTSGTSLASPYVAGAAALLLSREPTLTPAQVRERIVASAQGTIGGTPALTTNRALSVDW